MAFCPERPKWEQNPKLGDEHPRPFHMGVPSLAPPPRAWFSLINVKQPWTSKKEDRFNQDPQWLLVLHVGFCMVTCGVSEVWLTCGLPKMPLTNTK